MELLHLERMLREAFVAENIGPPYANADLLTLLGRSAPCRRLVSIDPSMVRYRIERCFAVRLMRMGARFIPRFGASQ